MMKATHPICNMPFGGDQCVKRMAVTLGLESTLRPRGCPKKE